MDEKNRSTSRYGLKDSQKLLGKQHHVMSEKRPSRKGIDFDLPGGLDKNLIMKTSIKDKPLMPIEESVKGSSIVSNKKSEFDQAEKVDLPPQSPPKRAKPQPPEENKFTLGFDDEQNDGVEEISMDKPKYGKSSGSPEQIEAMFKNTDNQENQDGFEFESFNWEDDENAKQENVQEKSPEKINLGQYEEPKEDENYDDDFEDDAKSSDSTPKRSTKYKPLQPKDAVKPSEEANFTKEEEEIMNSYNFVDENEKMTTKQKKGSIKETYTSQTDFDRETPEKSNLQTTPQEFEHRNRISEYLQRRDEKGRFPIDDILASRTQNREERQKPSVVDPFQRLRPKQTDHEAKGLKSPGLVSLQDARLQKQKGNIEKNLKDKIQNLDYEMIENLEKLMQQIDIGESGAELQGLHLQKPSDPEELKDDLEESQVSNNPFTNKNNFISYNSSDDEFQNGNPNQQPNSNQRHFDYSQPEHSKNSNFKNSKSPEHPENFPNPPPSNILRPLSSKRSTRYSKNNQN